MAKFTAVQRPASEPETQVVQALMQRKKPAIFADIHAYGELMLWPFGYSEKDVPHTPVFKQLYQETVKSLGFKGGTSTPNSLPHHCHHPRLCLW
jgi:hypothetical protein